MNLHTHIPADEEVKQLLARANPYIARVEKYPGRLFPFNNLEADRQAVQKLCAEASAVHVEIGSGSGGVIIERSHRDPNGKYFGLELRFKRMVRTMEKAEVRGLQNLYVIQLDARQIERVFPPGALDSLMMNFPDPWAKRRQLKHRVLNSEFLDVISRLLRVGGWFQLKTDHGDYHRFLREMVLERGSDAPLKIVGDTSDLYSSELLEGNIASEFEQMFVQERAPIHLLRLIKV